MTEAIAGGLICLGMFAILYAIYKRQRGWTLARVLYRIGSYFIAAGDASCHFYDAWRDYRQQADKRGMETD